MVVLSKANHLVAIVNGFSKCGPHRIFLL